LSAELCDFECRHLEMFNALKLKADDLIICLDEMYKSVRVHAQEMVIFF